MQLRNISDSEPVSICFGTNESDYRRKGETATRQPQKGIFGVLLAKEGGNCTISGQTSSPALLELHNYLCKKVCCLSQHSLKSVEEEPGDWPLHEETWRELQKGVNPAPELLSAPLCEERQEKRCQSGCSCACFWPNYQNQTSWRWHKGQRRSVGPVLTDQCCADRQTFAREHSNWEFCHWHRTRFTDESRFTLSTCDRHERVWRCCGAPYAACNIIRHNQFGSKSVIEWGGISLESHTERHV